MGGRRASKVQQGVAEAAGVRSVPRTRRYSLRHCLRSGKHLHKIIIPTLVPRHPQHPPPAPTPGTHPPPAPTVHEVAQELGGAARPDLAAGDARARGHQRARGHHRPALDLHTAPEQVAHPGSAPELLGISNMPAHLGRSRHHTAPYHQAAAAAYVRCEGPLSLPRKPEAHAP